VGLVKQSSRPATAPCTYRKSFSISSSTAVPSAASQLRPIFLPAPPLNDTGEDLKDALAQYERQHIIYSLRRHNYDKSETAKHLGIGVSSLYRKIDELNIPKNLSEPQEKAV
jgi:DNA-binding NtrC family response regulator